MKPTIRDVAEAAGVSATAVSKVLHGTGRSVRVSAQRAEHIRKVAADLRYQPNHLARSLRSRQTGTVSVVLQHFDRLSDDNPYFPQLLNGIMAALFPADMTLALCPKLVQRGDHSAIADGRFDGVLWCRPDFTEASVEILRTASLPIVMMHAPPGTAPGVSSFSVDNEAAMRLVVEHLTGLGHRRIGFVIDPVNAQTAEGRVRTAAFQQAMQREGLGGDVLVWDLEAPELENYRFAGGPHTALAAWSDFTAGRLLAACDRYGIRVPHELSIVGFDSSSYCQSTTPRLTAIYQPVERIAFEATTHLLALIQEEQGGAPASLPVSLVYDCNLDVRGSTSPPPR